MDKNELKIVLTCPECGNDSWKEDFNNEYGTFECSSCHNYFYPEEMCSSIQYARAFVYKTQEEKQDDCPCNGCVLAAESEHLQCELMCSQYSRWVDVPISEGT